MFGLRICRRSRQSLFRNIAVFLCLIVLVLMLRSFTTSSIDKYDSENNEHVYSVYTTVSQERNDIVPLRKYSTPYKTEYNEVTKTKLRVNMDNEIAELRHVVKSLNQEQHIRNLDKFHTRSEDSVVIVVQVHKRATYLIKLIESLRKAKGISDALLILSHDYFSSEINNIVQRIDFCQVLQIFFPYSSQLYPNKFPGEDPNDCPRDTSKSQAISMGCLNAEHPDMYGHYREVKFVMTKHHWWWKLNRVFRELKSTQNHQGLVLLLEEDHYVAPDFYKVLKKAYRYKKSDSKCREYNCDIIALGDYKRVSSFQSVGNNVFRIQPWISTENNMGMALDRVTFDKISICSEMFCLYDDYNWDWTLMRISSRCLKKPLTVLLSVAPRVFHLGTCGLHHQDANCNIQEVLAETQSVIKRSEDVLDPEILQIEIASPWVHGHFGQANGGWGDIRDRELCLNFTKSTN